MATRYGLSYRRLAPGRYEAQGGITIERLDGPEVQSRLALRWVARKGSEAVDFASSLDGLLWALARYRQPELPGLE